MNYDEFEIEATIKLGFTGFGILNDTFAEQIKKELEELLRERFRDVFVADLQLRLKPTPEEPSC